MQDEYYLQCYSKQHINLYDKRHENRVYTCTGQDKCILYALLGINVNLGKLHKGNMHSG